MRNLSNQQVKDFIRHKYAWPGGYPVFLVMRDGEAMCHSCVKDNAKLILRAGLQMSGGFCRDSWEPAGTEINYEDADLYCCNCNTRIESAYAEPEEAK